MSSGIKLTHEEVAECFTQHGCELLSEYKNARTKVKYRCGCGEVSEIVFYSFKAGNRCRSCGNRKNSERLTLLQKEAADKFSKINCKLLGEYKKSSEPVEFQCHCGRLAVGIPNNIWRRGRCGLCGLDARSKEGHYMWHPDRDEFKKRCNFKDRCHKLITMVLAVTGRVKNKKSAELLGYDYKELQRHIQSHPDWDSLKGKKWHTDHVFPIKAFIDHGISDLKIINALDNLRPLAASQNLCKNAKYDKDQFYKWLTTKGVVLNETSDHGF